MGLTYRAVRTPLRRTCGTFLATICVSGTLTVAPASAVTLKDQLQLLLRDNPQIARARDDVGAAREGENIANAPFLPEVTVSGDGGYENTDSPATRRSGRGDFSTSRYTQSLTVTQNLFDGQASTQGRRQAEFSTRIAEQTLRSTTQSVILEGATAYLNVLRQTELVKLARGNERTIRTQLELEDERVQRGSGIAVDVLLAKSRLQLAKERRVAFETGLRDAVSRYTQTFGQSPDVADLSPPQIPRYLLPPDLEGAISMVQDENPAIRASGFEVDLADAQRSSARSGFFPRVDLIGEQNWEKDFDGTRGIERNYSVIVQFNWDLFSGFATQAGVAQAAKQYSAARGNARFVERKAVEQLELSWHAFESTEQRRDLLRNAVNIAGEVFDSRKRLRDSGKETAINVLDAENELLNACINFVNADFDNQISVFQVLFSLGRLDPEALGVADDVTGTSPLAADAPELTARGDALSAVGCRIANG